MIWKKNREDKAPRQEGAASAAPKGGKPAAFVKKNWKWLVPVFCLPQFGLYVTRGDLLLNVLMCGLTMMLAWCAVRGLVWAKRTENGRLRRFHGTVLAFIALEYALWTASCFWVCDTLTNPYFWFDFLLTLVLLLFLPAVRKAVEA